VDSAFWCGRCREGWPVFAVAEQTSTSDPGPGEIVILGQVETRRTVTALGDTD
jgi:hypothetical protein